ncbi:unnamed protein product [Ranitomeya imitator]|uniref:Uncharacterized protein n=1 Tax=Ranitomeya imitator TaxID=111125 RepID=A0ABN9KYC4_9NEOB|nr:unnamed protein product [Ranitomeya imitator]
MHERNKIKRKVLQCVGAGKDENFRKFPPYPRIVPRDFIQGIKQDVQDKISKQETRPDRRALIYSNYPIEEEPNRYDGPPNFIFFRRKYKRLFCSHDKPPNKGEYKERLMKAFKNILCCCIHRADEIKKDNSAYVVIKKDKKIRRYGAGAYNDPPDEYAYDGIEEDKFILKNNRYNLIGANIDFPEEFLNFPIRETGLEFVRTINEIEIENSHL